MDPPFCIQMCSSSLKQMQILPMLLHRGNLKLWHDIGWIFVSWGYIEISPNNTSMGSIKNCPQPWTSLQQRWICQFFIPHAHINHPNFVAQHPETTWMRQGDKHSPHCLFFTKKCPPGKVARFWRFSHDDGLNAAVLAHHRTYQPQVHP